MNIYLGGGGGERQGCAYTPNLINLLQVVSCPRLMKVIFDEFLPLSWSWSGGGEGDEDGESSGSKDEVAHGRPQVTALRLVMAVCSAGRNLTSQLVRMMIVQNMPSITGDFH